MGPWDIFSEYNSHRYAADRNICVSLYFDFVILRSVRRLVVTANVVHSSPILVTLMLEELRSSETSVLTRAICRNIP
jgi:hypothetical protein